MKRPPEIGFYGKREQRPRSTILISRPFKRWGKAYAQGILHRDIESLNIMITPREQVKVLDFGRARREKWCQVSEDETHLMPLAGGSE